MSKKADKENSINLNNKPNNFLLSLAIAKRARQLQEGAKPLIPLAENEIMHPILTALKEFKDGKYDILLSENKDEDLEMIKEIDTYFDQALKKEKSEESNPKKDKDLKTKTKFKSLAA